jgi:hypothetical protein
MMAFVLDCHPEIAQIRQLNPGLSAVRDLPDIQYFSLSDSMKKPNRDASSTSQEAQGAVADLETKPVGKQQAPRLSPEETRRQARENWRRHSLRNLGDLVSATQILICGNPCCFIFAR